MRGKNDSAAADVTSALVTDEMVEAAIEAYCKERFGANEWFAMSNDIREPFRVGMRAALNAAAPLIVERCAQRVDAIAADPTREYDERATGDDIRALLA